MLIFIAVMWVVVLSILTPVLVIAVRRSRQAREEAIEPGADTLYRGRILLNSDGGFDDPNRYEIVVLPEQVQIRIPGNYSRIASAEWFLAPAELEVKRTEARFLWSMRPRPAISIRYKPKGAIVSFLVLATTDGRDAELFAALEAVIGTAKGTPAAIDGA
jgi:hypothetical protein